MAAPRSGPPSAPRPPRFPRPGSPSASPGSAAASSRRPALVLPTRAARRASLAATLGRAPETLADDTLDRLTALLEHLALWTRRINLVGPSTLPDAWARHVLDAAALAPLLPPDARRLVDLGSGAGFPGLVLAILGAPDPHLVESDQRKAAFLREAARVTETAVTVHATRIETLAPLAADVVTARALAPLPELLPLVVRHLAADGVALLPKGRGVQSELTACADRWIMRVAPHAVRHAAPDVPARPVPPCPDPAAPSGAPVAGSSVTAPASRGPDGVADAAGCILILREIRRVPSDL